MRRLAAFKRYSDEHVYLDYKPYPKQLEFHNAGAKYHERALMAGNRLGKTHAACRESTYHLLGASSYPDWWQGKRFNRPIKMIAVGKTAKSTREVLQVGMLGEMHAIGTRAIPRENIEKITMARGLANTVDSVLVKRPDGKFSQIIFMANEQGYEKFMGMKLDVVHFDEEPDGKVYNEGIMRTMEIEGGGITYLTFTPLKGAEPGGVVERFFPHPKTPDRHLTMFDIGECPHFADFPDKMRTFIASLAPWELEARKSGIPTMGGGRLFTTPEGDISEPSMSMPKHWPRLVGLDFGWNHPTAAVWGAIDRETDTIHIYDAYRRAEQTPDVHAAAIKNRGAWIPIAWPHDGMVHDKGSGVRLKEMYRESGLKMLPKHAHFKDGSMGFEAGVLEMYQRFASGRLKIANHLFEIFEEYRAYHRDEKGKIVKVRDDLLSAIRYLQMMARYARLPVKPQQPTTVGLDYDPYASLGAGG